MNLILYNQKTDIIQEVTISELSELNDLIEVYFNIKKINQNITINDDKLDMNKHITEVGLNNGDMLIVNENHFVNKNDFVNENDFVSENDFVNGNQNKTNALDDHMDNMIMQSQISYTLINIKGEYNDIAFKIIIDSGASTSIMSNYMAELLGISHLIDTRMSGIANGIGTSKIFGCIFGCNIKINNNIFIPVNLKILDNKIDKHLVILGLDFLYTYGCLVDFKNRSLKVNDQNIPFMNEKEVNDYNIPFNIKKETLKKQFDEMINLIPYNQRLPAIELLKKIINNIINNPSDEKYKLINTENSNFKEILSKHQECINFMKNLGFAQMNDGKLKFNNGIDILNYTNEIMSA